MEIQDRSPYTNLDATALRSAAGPAAVAPHGASRANAPAVQANLSDSSQLSPASRIAAEAASLPEVRQERVDALQQQIARGTYQVSATDVADALVRQFRG